MERHADGHRHRVLVVEDGDDLRESVDIVLTHRGFHVLQATDGQEALDILRDGAQCCVVLLDWRMPRLSGAEFLAIKASDPAIADLPVVVASGDVGRVAREAKGHVRQILAKPVGPDTLAGVLALECRHDTQRIAV